MDTWSIQPRGEAGQSPPVRYHSVRVLAVGSHSRVHLCRADDGTWAALKLATGPVERREVEFSIEARIVEQLDHPNVVRYLGSGAGDDAVPVLAYERVHENPLLLMNRPAIRARLPNDPKTRYYPLPVRPALALATDLFRALEHLHRRSFVHHDVKLANLMLRVTVAEEAARDAVVLDRALAGDAQGVLVDFGAARSAAFLAELNRGQTTDHRLAPSQLTPIYAPPEALDPGHPVFDPSIDVYAAALVLYSCVSGRAPYDHVRTDPDLALLRELKAQERAGRLVPTSFEALSGAAGTRSIAGELNGLLSACLHRSPSERPSPTDARRYAEELLELCSSPTRGPRRPPGQDTFFGTTGRPRGRLP
jgi:eukaryotic-like serine/threonine-protein kinase